MEVMGLMLGEFVDDYTVRVVDVFAMPQSGTGVSVEAVDPVFQTKMMDMLRQTGRCVETLIHGSFESLTSSIDQRQLSVGITHIQDSDVGYLQSTSTHNSPSNNSLLVRSLWLSIPYSQSRARLSLTLSV